MRNNNVKCQKGFSLIELAIVLSILGLLLGTFLEQYNQSHRARFGSDSSAHADVIQTALDKFLTENGRLPCPAKPGLPLEDANAGLEQCSLGLALGTSSSGFWHVVGFRDTDADANGTVDNIYIGSIPFTTLNIAPKQSLDGYGNKFLYAVSEYLTDKVTYKDTRGVIGMRAPIFDPVTHVASEADATISLNGVDTLNATRFVLLSHGENGVGAYNPMGVKAKPCAGAQNGHDLGNCGNTGKFYDYTTQGASSVEGADYADDKILATENTPRVDRWGYGDIASKKISNTGNSRVGIGTDTPSQYLDVNGSIRANKFSANRYCNAAGVDCFGAEKIAGSGMSCANNGSGAVTGIAYSAVVCADALNVTGVTPDTCGTGQFLIGVNADGTIKCATP